MIEAGHFALVLAFALALIQSTVPLIGARSRDERMMAVGGPVAVTGFALAAVAFAALTMAYVQSDFSVANVWENSHSAKPLLFKVTGTWGNHEGSMLLWVLILAFFGALVAVFGAQPAGVAARQRACRAGLDRRRLPAVHPDDVEPVRPPRPGADRRAATSTRCCRISASPSIRRCSTSAMSASPISFSFAVAALIDGRIDAAWARWVRPWTLAAWMFLTGGIAMGSYWAYYELGWGGFWFWDPVENASFMPWLAGTALLHSAIVMEKRSALKIWTILLAILTFSLSLLGTFLVRSGVLTSVHAFATDPTRGVFILAILTLFIGGSLALFAWRAGALTAGGLFDPISREGALVLNNLFLTTAAATVLIGTLYPLVLEAMTGDKISVGAPFFNMTFGPLMLPLLVVVPFGPLLAWKRGDSVGAAQRLYAAFGGALLAVAGRARSSSTARRCLRALGVGLAVWLVLGALTDLAHQIGLGSVALGVSLRRARRPAALGVRHGARPCRPRPDVLGIVGDARLRDRERSPR